MQFLWPHINREATWNICTYLSQNYFCLSLSMFLLLWGWACTGLQPTGARLLCQHLHLGRGGVGESRRRAERERESNDSSRAVNADHISQRPHQSEGRKCVAASQCKAARDGGNEWQIDRQAERWTEQGTQHLFISHDPVVAMWLSVTQPKRSGIVGESVYSFATTNSLFSLFIILTVTTSHRRCVCVCVCPHTLTS